MYGDCVIYLMLCHALNDRKSLDGPEVWVVEPITQGQVDPTNNDVTIF